MPPVDRSKTLEQLEHDVWPEPHDPTRLVSVLHTLRRKPLDQFTVEDLRIMILQERSLEHLVPLALEKLWPNLLVAGDLYDGDLLNAVLKVPPSFWKARPALLAELADIASRLEEWRDTINAALPKANELRDLLDADDGG